MNTENTETFPKYQHSGKFGIHGPALALVAAAAAAFPLGLVYAYLVKWIPFVYANFLATLGYGFVIGLLAGWLMKLGKVRNNLVAGFTGLGVGLIALYFAWTGHINATFRGMPLCCGPFEVIAAMKQLYVDGSWGMRGGGNMTGIPLAIVWVIEAGMIVGIATLATLAAVSDLPYCETSQRWLDKDTKINTLEAFSDPAVIESFKQGDLSPLTKARPKPPVADVWARLTLKYAPDCQTLYTVRIQNVTREYDKKGNAKEKTTDLTQDLIVPQSMFELISKFEKFNPPPPGAPQPQNPASAA